LRNVKSPGQNTITNEMLKYAGDTLIKVIIKMEKEIFLNARIPEHWKTSIVLSVFKMVTTTRKIERSHCFKYFIESYN
jgi:hypothetical protein